MKSRKTSTLIIEKYKLDYENGILCDVTIKNKKLFDFSFHTKGKNKLNLMVVENIDEVLNHHWSEHHNTIITKEFSSIDDLKKFNDFDDLYYIGASRDGIVKDKNGNILASIIILSDSLFSIYCHIKRKTDVDILKEKLSKSKNIFDIKDYTIPYYNGGGESIQAKMKISDKLLNKHLNSSEYLDEYKKIAIIEDLIGESIIIPEIEYDDDDDDDDDDECYCTC